MRLVTGRDRTPSGNCTDKSPWIKHQQRADRQKDPFGQFRCEPMSIPRSGSQCHDTERRGQGEEVRKAIRPCISKTRVQKTKIYAPQSRVRDRKRSPTGFAGSDRHTQARLARRRWGHLPVRDKYKPGAPIGCDTQCERKRWIVTPA